MFTDGFPFPLFTCAKSTIEKRSELCSKLTIKTPERRYWLHSGVFIVNFEHISYPFLVFLLLTLNRELKIRVRKFKFT